MDMSDYTEEQIIEFKTRFARRRLARILVAIPVVAFIFFSGTSMGRGKFFDGVYEVAGPVGVAALLGILVALIYKWRCPACNGYLGRAFSPKYCPKCGVELS